MYELHFFMSMHNEFAVTQTAVCSLEKSLRRSFRDRETIIRTAAVVTSKALSIWAKDKTNCRCPMAVLAYIHIL